MPYIFELQIIHDYYLLQLFISKKTIYLCNKSQVDFFINYDFFFLNQLRQVEIILRMRTQS